MERPKWGDATLHDSSVRRQTLSLCASIVIASLLGPDGAVCAQRYDRVLVGGTVVDGTGMAPIVADVALRGDQIVFVGDASGQRAKHRIDCRGLIVTPGFIDLHNHSDSAVLASESRDGQNYLRQGCTTLVTGNCGAGRFPVRPYLAELERQRPGVNVAHLIPHGTLRASVLGQVKATPSATQLERMERLVAQGMREGAWGMSTGLIYVPGTYAETNELIALSRVVGAHGGIYASHMRNEEKELLAAVDEALRIGREAPVSVHLSHFKVVGRPFWGLVRAAAERVEQARAAGQVVTADQYPYEATSTTLSAMLLPGWAREGGRAATAERVRDPQQIEAIRSEIASALEVRHHIRIAAYESQPAYIGMRLRDIATEERRDAIDVALDIIAGGDAAAVNFALDERDIRYVMQRPWVAVASDGSLRVPSPERVHPRSYGTFPRRVAHYSLQEEVTTLAAAVRAASGLPADILGMHDRGYLRVGQKADIVVFDPAMYRDTATYDDPHQYATGIRWLFVNGTPAIADSEFMGEFAGRVLRKTPR